VRPPLGRAARAAALAALVAAGTVTFLSCTAFAGPRIAFDHREHHFGRVVQGKVVETSFPLRNVGDADLVLEEVTTPCGCTAVLPEKTVLKPGEETRIDVTYDSAARAGEVERIITVRSNDPVEPVLELRVVADVDASMHAAFEAGEALFGPKCGECHYDPAEGLAGGPLYEAVCFFCHGKAREGKTATALRVYPPSADPYLTEMISRGRPGTEMPGFAREHGGPLSPDQVRSLVQLLHTEPPPAPAPEPGPEPVREVGDPDAPFFQ